MPERRNRRSEKGKPAGSMIAASTPRHAQVRNIAPALAAISGSNSASVSSAVDIASALRPNRRPATIRGARWPFVALRWNMPTEQANCGPLRRPRGATSCRADCTTAPMDNEPERCEIALKSRPADICAAAIHEGERTRRVRVVLGRSGSQGRRRVVSARSDWGFICRARPSRIQVGVTFCSSRPARSAPWAWARSSGR